MTRGATAIARVVLAVFLVVACGRASAEGTPSPSTAPAAEQQTATPAASGPSGNRMFCQKVPSGPNGPLVETCSSSGPSGPGPGVVSGPTGSGITGPTGSIGPDARLPNLAYDSTRKVVLLFGGSLGNVPPPTHDDTWTWDGLWALHHPRYSPPARWRASLADDPATGSVLLFGGDNMGTNLDDTWSWDGTEWKVLVPAAHPSARHGAAMAYDPVRRQVVLFGGQAGGNQGDTWTWDGTTWNQRTPANSPPPRVNARLAFDEARGVMVLFGGFDGLADTWTWDGTNWTQLHPLRSPPGYLEATPNVDQMVWDNVRRDIVFTKPAQDGQSMETWTWDGSIWTRDSPPASPPPAAGSGLAFDRGLGLAVSFGGWGINQSGPGPTAIWTWDGATWKRA